MYKITEEAIRGLDFVYVDSAFIGLLTGCHLRPNDYISTSNLDSFNKTPVDHQERSQAGEREKPLEDLCRNMPTLKWLFMPSRFLRLKHLGLPFVT